MTALIECRFILTLLVFPYFSIHFLCVTLPPPERGTPPFAGFSLPRFHVKGHGPDVTASPPLRASLLHNYGRPIVLWGWVEVHTTCLLLFRGLTNSTKIWITSWTLNRKFKVSGFYLLQQQMEINPVFFIQIFTLLSLDKENIYLPGKSLAFHAAV